MSIATGTKSLIRAAFMPAATILLAIALYFTGQAVAAGALLKAAATVPGSKETESQKASQGLIITAAVIAWIAYVMIIVGAVISSKKAKM